MLGSARLDEEKQARLLLVPLLAVIFIGAALAPWHSPTVCDTRTLMEMIQGVVAHGLPVTENGPAEDFPELQARWNLVHNGQRWGKYPPVFPYAAAPFYFLDGFRGVVRFNIALLAAVAVLTFLLGRRVTRSPRAATASAYLVVAGTPVVGSTFDTTSFPLMVVFVVSAAYAAVRALEAEPEKLRGWSILAGLMAALAAGTHAIAGAVLVSVMAGLVLLPGEHDAEVSPPRRGLFPFLPSRLGIRRGAFAVLGALGPIAAVSALNAVRFGTYGPISYAADLCPWRECEQVAGESVGAMVSMNLPALAWMGVTAIALIAARRSPLLTLAVGCASIATILAVVVVRHGVLTLGATALGYTADMSFFDVQYEHHPGAPGNFRGPYVVKAMLQSTPALGLAALAWLSARGSRSALRLPALIIAAVLLAVSLRGFLPGAHRFGVPYLHMRYTFPVLPLLSVLAVAALQGLRWRARSIAGVVMVAAAFGAWLATDDNDFDPVRRMVLLFFPLAALLVSLPALYLAGVSTRPLWSKLALGGAVVVLGYGFAVTTSVDVLALVAHRNADDRLHDAIARQTPERLALVGWPHHMEPALALRGERDLVYADFLEIRDWNRFRDLLHVFRQEGRPVYLVQPPYEPWNPWPEVRSHPIDESVGLYRLDVGPRPPEP